jgi:hypothetical protein
MVGTRNKYGGESKGIQDLGMKAERRRPAGTARCSFEDVLINIKEMGVR